VGFSDTFVRLVLDPQEEIKNIYNLLGRSIDKMWTELKLKIEDDGNGFLRLR